MELWIQVSHSEPPLLLKYLMDKEERGPGVPSPMHSLSGSAPQWTADLRYRENSSSLALQLDHKGRDKIGSLQ